MSKKRTFTVVLEPEADDGGYSVHCPALPGCHSQGETRSEAPANIKEAIQLVWEVRESDAMAPEVVIAQLVGPPEEWALVAAEIGHILRARHDDGLPLTIETAQVEVSIGVPA